MTLLLKGGLNQMIFRFRFRLCFESLFGGVNVNVELFEFGATSLTGPVLPEAKTDLDLKFNPSFRF